MRSQNRARAFSILGLAALFFAAGAGGCSSSNGGSTPSGQASQPELHNPCTGTPLDCDTFETSAECFDQQGCTWLYDYTVEGSVCSNRHGSAMECGVFNGHRAWCLQQLGCAYHNDDGTVEQTPIKAKGTPTAPDAGAGGGPTGTSDAGGGPTGTSDSGPPPPPPPGPPGPP